MAAQRNRSPFGSVKIVAAFDAREARFEDASPTLVEQHVWTPSVQIADMLPQDFRITFDVYRAEASGRWFVPQGGLGMLRHAAWLAGVTILKKHKGLSENEINSYRAMHFIVQRACQTKAHIDRAFSSATDLIVRPSGRVGGASANVLPSTLGLDSKGTGKQWSVDRLIQEGRAAAEDAGITHPRFGELLAYGLMVAARLDPLEWPEAGVDTLVRTVLFDFERHAVASDPETVLLVYSRLCDAMNAHEADSQTDFDGWFVGGKSNLPKSLGNQVRAPGGRLSTKQVNSALLELAWQGYRYEADCLNAFAQAFMQALPTPLDPTERQKFSQMYQPQGYLGGLPLALVRERSELLKPILLEVWDSPEDTTLPPVLWRMLWYYAEMITARRRADREVKRPRASDSARTGTAISELDQDECAETLGTAAGMICQGCNCPIHYQFELLVEEASVLITAQCREHGPLHPRVLKAAEASRLIQDRERGHAKG